MYRKQIKKILLLVLAIVMAVSIAVVPASAASKKIHSYGVCDGDYYIVLLCYLTEVESNSDSDIANCFTNANDFIVASYSSDGNISIPGEFDKLPIYVDVTCEYIDNWDTACSLLSTSCTVFKLALYSSDFTLIKTSDLITCGDFDSIYTTIQPTLDTFIFGNTSEETTEEETGTQFPTLFDVCMQFWQFWLGDNFCDPTTVQLLSALLAVGIVYFVLILPFFKLCKGGRKS